ncbi:hypothetical protein EGR_01694 [Echinococcus granulosus]|uniref:Uncharacterized protein n=1 Tax=Echinococcus granulosus TaxID=6210 RepID=W6UYB4_ECHGR|nr:hypothetical protein EGR_01694 [Echinococcus granulosus]EUB63612.1 hypothetical protein EGR_01694 [Echinococcus granulosus]
MMINRQNNNAGSKDMRLCSSTFWNIHLDVMRNAAFPNIRGRRAGLAEINVKSANFLNLIRLLNAHKIIFEFFTCWLAFCIHTRLRFRAIITRMSPRNIDLVLLFRLSQNQSINFKVQDVIKFSGRIEWWQVGFQRGQKGTQSYKYSSIHNKSNKFQKYIGSNKKSGDINEYWKRRHRPLHHGFQLILLAKFDNLLKKEDISNDQVNEGIGVDEQNLVTWKTGEVRNDSKVSWAALPEPLLGLILWCSINILLRTSFNQEKGLLNDSTIKNGFKYFFEDKVHLTYVLEI